MYKHVLTQSFRILTLISLYHGSGLAGFRNIFAIECFSILTFKTDNMSGQTVSGKLVKFSYSKLQKTG